VADVIVVVRAGGIAVAVVSEVGDIQAVRRESKCAGHFYKNIKQWSPFYGSASSK